MDRINLNICLSEKILSDRMWDPENDYTRFEIARIIGARALQIARGAPIMIDTDLKNPIKIAELEFEKGVIPINVKRREPPRLDSSV